MPKVFQYDVIQLIEAIRDRPCLWDKRLESYKDRVERRDSWEEIFRILDENYHNMEWEEKRLTGEVIVNKWTNVRDTFIKSLKTRMGKPKKKYILHDHLKFLTAVTSPEEPMTVTIEYENEDNDDQNNEQASEESTNYVKDDEGTSYVVKKKKKKIDDNEDYVPTKKKKSDQYEERSERPKRSKRVEDYESQDTEENIDFVEVNDSEPRLMNEDEAFFASLLPTVVRYNEDERLEFRIEVLAVMKKIQDKRKWTGDN